MKVESKEAWGTYRKISFSYSLGARPEDAGKADALVMTYRHSSLTVIYSSQLCRVSIDFSTVLPQKKRFMHGRLNYVKRVAN